MNTPLHQYLMALPAATLDFPFGDDIYVYKLEGKVFAIYVKDGKVERINLKCEPEQAQQLRAIFSEITPGYHMNKKHWNTVDLTGDLPLSEVCKWVDHSYDLIAAKLPKPTRQRLRVQHERLAWLK